MGTVHYKSNHDRAREQKALGGVEIKDGVIQNLDSRGLLYQAGDYIDEQKVYD